MEHARDTARRRVFVVDDHPVVRDGLHLLLSATKDLVVCGGARDQTSALAGIAKLSPDLVIVDLRLGDESGFELIKQARDRFGNLPILVLSMHDEDVYAERVLKAGARGYVMKGEPTRVLLDGIRTVLDGHVFVSGRIAARAVERMARGTIVGPNPMAQLTDRELQVFELLGRGLSSREIADELDVGTKTVETHRHNIKTKLGCRSATEVVHQATLWVEREGLE
jgi:DNA-binding NarL/FixJ family response regulator